MKGFTLFELLVVLVIVGLMAAFVVPKMAGSMVNVDLRSASKNIMASLRYARSHAVSERRTYAAQFDFEKGRLSIVPRPRVSGEAPEEDSVDEAERAGRVKVYDLPKGVRLEKALAGHEEVDSGLFQMVFFSNGSSTGGDIIVSNDRGKSYRIHADFVTGIVILEAVSDHELSEVRR